jgi:hypothetical protein
MTHEGIHTYLTASRPDTTRGHSRKQDVGKCDIGHACDAYVLSSLSSSELFLRLRSARQNSTRANANLTAINDEQELSPPQVHIYFSSTQLRASEIYGVAAR